MIISSRDGSEGSYGISNLITGRNSEQEKIKTNKKRLRKILKGILIFICLGIIIYLFIDDSLDKAIPITFYDKIIKNYKNILPYTYIINFFTNYFIFILFFIFGFCLWNIYKSFMHFLGYFSCYYILFFLQLLIKREPLLLTLSFDKDRLSTEELDTLCEYTTEYGKPSYRAAFIIYSYLSFIALLFKEKKLRDNIKCKAILYFIFSIICILLNISLIFLLQDTVQSILIGMLIGFIIYFFMFSTLRINYGHTEQMLFILNLNIIYYILINLILFFILFSLYKFKPSNPEIDNKFKNLCGNTEHYFKNMNLETFVKSLIFYCNIIMIISIKIQRKCMFKTDNLFISRNFLLHEIMERELLMSRISDKETNKINLSQFFYYICKVLICVLFGLINYLILMIIDYYQKKTYEIASILSSVVPINLMVICIFIFAKPIFIKLRLEENDNDSD